MKVYVYAGYYELYVSSKPMVEPYMYQGELETVTEAEDFIEENFPEDNYYVEKRLFPLSRRYTLISGSENFDVLVDDYTFNLNENGEIIENER